MAFEDYESGEKSEIGFNLGERVIVERSSGEQEVWTVLGVDENRVNVASEERDGKRNTKDVDRGQLEQLNYPVKSDDGWVELMTKSKGHIHTPKMVEGAIAQYKQQMNLSADYELNIEEFKLGVVGSERVHVTANEMLRILQDRFDKIPK